MADIYGELSQEEYMDCVIETDGTIECELVISTETYVIADEEDF